MKIALVAFNHSESTITLLKYLVSKGSYVDYFYITDYKDFETSAFEFHKAKKGLGRIKLNAAIAPQTFNYVNNERATLNLLRLISLGNKFSLINSIIVSLFCRSIRKNSYDIINIVGQNKILKVFYEKLKDLKVVHTLHEVKSHYKEQNLEASLIELLFYKEIPIIVHSNAAYNEIFKYAKIKKDLIKVIPFGLFEPYLGFNSIPACNIICTPNIILFYGFLRPYKGIDILIDSINEISKSINDFKIIIAGSGYLCDLERVKNDNRFILLNKKISNGEIVYLNKISKIVVCPYKSASQSGIVMTTFLFDKPIIATKVGAFAEMIEDGVNGILIEPNSVQELSIALIKLIKDKELYSRLQDGVKEFSKKKSFNWNNIVQETLDFYKSI